MGNTSRSMLKRSGAIAAAAAIGLSMAPAIAGAAMDEDGKRTGPVQFWAEGNDECQVTFTISNRTNSANYLLDYNIDEEEPNGADYGTGKRGRFAVRSSAVAPTYPGSGVGYVRDRAPVESTKTITLNNPEQVTNLPNPEADGHTVRFRMILGPEKDDRGSGEWYSTTVSGCDTTAPAVPTDVTVDPPEPTAESIVTASGKAEPGSEVTVTADTGENCTTTADADTGDFSCELGTLPAGDRTITATATDAVGNEGEGASIEVTVAPADQDECETGSVGSLGSSCGAGGFGSLGTFGSAFEIGS